MIIIIQKYLFKNNHVGTYLMFLHADAASYNLLQ